MAMRRLTQNARAGIFNVNLHNGARWSAADAFLTPAKATGRLSIKTHANVDRISGLTEKGAKHVYLINGQVMEARKAIVLSAGSIGSPQFCNAPVLVMRNIFKACIDVVRDCPAGARICMIILQLGCTILARDRAMVWSLNNCQLGRLRRLIGFFGAKGGFASQIVEAGAFFRANPEPEGDDRPDLPVPFYPFQSGPRKAFHHLGLWLQCRRQYLSATFTRALENNVKRP